MAKVNLYFFVKKNSHDATHIWQGNMYLLFFYYLYRVSRPSFVTVKKEESRYNAEHVLELKNNGPSILPDAYLTIRYPQVQSGGQAHVFLNKTTVSTKYIFSFFL